MTTLLVDVGNSTTILGKITARGVEQLAAIKTSDLSQAFNQAQGFGCDRTIVSSVVPAVDPILKVHLPNPTWVTWENIPLLKLNLKMPSEVGADRIVNALGAYDEWKRNCLIIDSGTAISLCYVTKEGVYEGGVILPGMGIASQALNLFTAKIPRIEVKPWKELLGKTTEEAVQSGFYFGYGFMLNGYCEAFRRQDPEVRIIGTGNGLTVLKDILKIDHYDPVLTLKGLAVCSRYV